MSGGKVWINRESDMTWAIPIFMLFALAFLFLDLQALVCIYCIKKRARGDRAASWLEFIAGYDKEQRLGRNK